MDPEPSAVLACIGGTDRLSRLGDGTLGHILSFLPADEAARAAALSRRWRHVFADVHTISFTEPTRPVPHDDDDFDDESHSSGSDDEDEEDEDDDYSSSSSSEDNPTSPLPTRAFVDAVSAALHCRHRGAHVTCAPLRGLRVEFGNRDTTASAAAIDGLLHYAMHQTGDELHVDLRLGHGQSSICDRPYLLRRHDTSTPWRPRHTACESLYAYALPRSLFCCAALRSLRLVSCRLDPPAATALPSLDTLHLKRVSGGVRRLVAAGFPRLADLTLEACSNLKELSILSARLRRLALLCCHDLTAVVAADLLELRSFEYSGAGPGPSFQTVHAPRRISSCTLNFCGEEATEPTELANLRGFLQVFASAANLQLKSARLGSGVGHGVLSAALELPWFPALRNLELTGMLPEDDVDTVAAVARMLERTPTLETLSLFFMPVPEIPDYICYHEDKLRAAHKLRYNGHMTLDVPEGAATACLRERTREINLVHYHGGTAQRMLAKFLLCNARVVDEVYCEFARGPLFIQTKLMEEITGWVMNKSANMVFF